MSTSSQIDPNTLGWVKAEIEESLKRANLALESFVDNPSDDTRLRFCVTHLHQVVGTLQMVELDGAALLAQEAETLAEDILEEKIKADEKLFELLTRAMLLLPDYLGGLQFGQVDAPLRLLPTINEFRDARKAERVSEDQLFTPDLSVRPPPHDDDESKLGEPEYAELAQKLRPQFQVGLLSWLRDTSDANSLESIAATVAELEHYSPIGVVEQLFWVASGLLEALGANGLDATDERKKLVARLDQQIKKLIDGTEKSVLRNTSESLVKAMLFQLGAAKSDGPKVAQLRRAFDLDTLLGWAVSEDGQTEVPEADTIRSVSAALGQETQSAQELLAAYFDPDQEDVTSLEPLLDLLHKMSSTMDLLGIPTLKRLVDELHGVAGAVVDGKLEASEEVSMRMAHALLLVENCARDIWSPNWKSKIEDWTKALHGLLEADGGEVPDVDGIEVSEVSDTEFGELLGVVASEIRINLTKVEEAVETFAADTTDLSPLAEIADHMGQIHGALQILGETRALELAEVVGARLDEIRAGTLTPNHAVMDALAVCVGTLSAHAEGLQLGRADIDDLMDAAINDMDMAIAAAKARELDPSTLIEDIQSSLNLWIADPANRETADALQQRLEHISVLAQAQGHEKIERISTETGTLVSILAEDPSQFSGEISETLKRSVDALAALAYEHLVFDAGQAPVTTEPVSAVPAAASDAETADLSQIAEATAAELTEVAADMAPTAVAANEPVATSPVDEIEMVSEPVEAPTADDTGPAVAEIEAEIPAPEPPSTPTVEPSPPPAAAAPEPALDPELLEIFTEEAREVLQTINKQLPVWGNDPSNADALAEVRRGFHTFKGSGRMVGASDIAELGWAVENLLNKVRDGKITHSDAVLDLVAKVTDVLPSMVDHLEGGAAPSEDIESLRQRAHALASGELPVAAPAPKTAAPTPTPDEVAIDEPTPSEPASGEVTVVEVVPSETAPSPEVESIVPGLEPTLRQIFMNETEGHLRTVQQEIATCREAGGSGMVSRNLMLAVHTLHGGAHSVGLRSMSEACGEMERVLRTLDEARHPLERPNLVLLDELVVCISSLLTHLNDESATTAREVRDRFQAFSRRARNEMIRLPVPESSEEPKAAAPAQPEAAPRIVERRKPSVPPKPTPAPAGIIDEDIDAELVDVFLEEATDLLAAVEESLTQWRADQAQVQAVEDMKRALHTLKGGARMASAMVVGNLAHAAEDLLRHVEEDQIAPTPKLFDLLDEVHDTLVTHLDQIRHAQPLSSVDKLNHKIERMLAGETLADNQVATPTEDQPKAADAVAAMPVEDLSSAESVSSSDDSALPWQHVERRSRDDDPAEATRARRDRRGQVRVRTAVLTDLVNDASEVTIARSRMEQQIYGFRDNLGELNRNVVRFREQLRELEIQSESQILYKTEQADEVAPSSGFDPLELDRYSRLQQLSRGLTESLHDLSQIQTNLHTFAGEAETVLQQQARINTSLQEGLMRTRTIAFSTQSARLRHMTRQTARELDKRAELQITGTDVDVDRNVLERMMGPFEHMIRNSLDHGIESAAERQQAGKPAVGRITIDTRNEGTDIAIRFSDDGAGLNIDAIRRHAIANGLMSEDKDLPDDELIQFILVSGFSTAREVTHLSGRGVGMDVVENEVKQLGGNISVATVPGQGTTFTIHLPVTLSIMQALLVHVGEQFFAVPLSAIMNILEVPAEQLNISLGKKPLLSYNDQVYAFMHVGTRLGISSPRNGAKVPVLLAKIGTREVAIQVDGFAGTKEIVVKTLGPQLSELKELAGATILGDGKVLLILDIAGLWLTGDAMQVEHAPEPEVAARSSKRYPVIMVVDDSLTVRKVTGKHLQKRGMEVLTAKDGQDALEQLQEHIVDIMLIDIEMPRMDGYELTSRIRADARLEHIPIIIITSRAGEKHRQRAFELGVNLYMSKPYHEDDLFKNIDQLLVREPVD
jgi:chemosensory pili system protein ChpA (sensor histidine kinase/response regulator)